MPDLAELSDADFDAQMQGLVHEAERALGVKGATEQPRPEASVAAPSSASLPTATPSTKLAAGGVAEMLRPLVVGVQAVGRATGEQTQILQKVEGYMAAAAEAQNSLPEIVAELKGLMEQRHAVSRQMFDALYSELKGYKDGFLLDSVHKPVIRDLIAQHDGMEQIFVQMTEALKLVPVDASPELWQRLQGIRQHLEHNIGFVLEVLERLEVQRLPVGKGKLDMLTQRAVDVVPAESEAEDMELVTSLKRGFRWGDRVVRPEEVVVKRWREGISMTGEEPSA